jgi:hypothetical protein
MIGIPPAERTRHRWVGVVRALTALAATAALAGCSSMPSWMPSWLGGAPSGAVEPAPLVEFAPTLSPRLAWRTNVGSARGAYLQPAVLENAIYAASGDGVVVRLAPSVSVRRRGQRRVRSCRWQRAR